MCKQKLSTGFILFFYILVAASCSGNGKKAAEAGKNEKVSVIEVSIGGMSCTGCEQTIRNNVGKLEGIKSVQASFTTGIAMIEYVEGVVDTTGIKEAINGSGYTVKKFITPAGQEGDR